MSSSFGNVKLFGNTHFPIHGMGNVGTISKNYNGQVVAQNCELKVVGNFNCSLQVSNSWIEADKNFNLSVVGDGHKLKMFNTFGVNVDNNGVSDSNSVRITPMKGRHRNNDDDNTQPIRSFFRGLLGSPARESTCLEANEGNRNFNATITYASLATVNDNQFKLGIFQTKVEQAVGDKMTVLLEILNEEEFTSFQVVKESEVLYVVTATTHGGKRESLKVSGVFPLHHPEGSFKFLIPLRPNHTFHNFQNITTVSRQKSVAVDSNSTTVQPPVDVNSGKSEPHLSALCT